MSEIIEDQQCHITHVTRLTRIVVVGVTGSGKTTLARQLAAQLNTPHIELDALYWDANWTQVAPESFRERVAQALAGACWVTDGNYSKVHDLTWGQADTVVWLDYRLWRILMRLVIRTFRRALTQEELWNGNCESLPKFLFTRDSLFLWALKTYYPKRRKYLAAQADPMHAHLDIVRLRTPRETQKWLASLPVLRKDMNV